MANTSNNAKKKQYVNPIEAVTHIGDDVVDSIKTDLLQQSADAFWDQILGTGSSKKSGELREGQEISFAKKEKPKAEHKDVLPGLDYQREILDGEKRISKEAEYTMQRQIEEILIELRKIVSSSQELEITYRDIVIEQRVVKPGTYHKTFFQFILTMLRSARQKIEDSSAWMAVAKGKHGKKKDYWQMFRQHGTTFGMSHERNVATQSG